MSHLDVWRLKDTSVFIVIVGLIYATLFVVGDYLQGPLWDDEIGFWKTSLEFSHQLFPSFSQIRDYNQFNTPVPFIIYGILENLFQLGPFAARLLNFILSLLITFLIGWPGKKQQSKPIFAMLGLFLFPWYLWLSTRLYTDVLAAFFGLLGVIGYLKQRHILSGLAFIVAIACRQFMLAFPVAIAAHELISAIRNRARPSLSFVFPALAALSIVIWVLLFNGLTPSAARDARVIPEVQQSLWTLSPSNGLFFLFTIGWSYVIPEFLLFKPKLSITKATVIRAVTIAIATLALTWFFTPQILDLSVITNLTDRVSSSYAYFLLVFGISLSTCWRFSRINLTFWMLFFNTLIMMKAVTWDKYALPLVIILWYLRSVDSREEPLITS